MSLETRRLVIGEAEVFEEFQDQDGDIYRRKAKTIKNEEIISMVESIGS